MKNKKNNEEFYSKFLEQLSSEIQTKFVDPEDFWKIVEDETKTTKTKNDDGEDLPELPEEEIPF